MYNGGSLTVVGSGIRAIGHMTLETQAHIKQAEKLLVLVADPLTEKWINDENPTAESLKPFYGREKDRLQTYFEMADYVMSFVRKGLRVCLVSYGHPGIFAFPTHLSVKLARAEGHRAEMLAGVSADACLFADLGVDPGQGGYQSFEATDFLARHRRFDPFSQLVLWQIGVIGMLDYNTGFDPQIGLRVLTDRLAATYPADHRVTVYEATVFAGCDSRIDTVALEDLPSTPVTGISTLYIPPVGPVEIDEEVLECVGVSAELRASRRQTERQKAELMNRLRAAAVVG
jgi:hypothetical protein